MFKNKIDLIFYPHTFAVTNGKSKIILLYLEHLIYSTFAKHKQFDPLFVQKMLSQGELNYYIRKLPKKKVSRNIAMK